MAHEAALQTRPSWYLDKRMQCLVPHSFEIWPCQRGHKDLLESCINFDYPYAKSNVKWQNKFTTKILAPNSGAYELWSAILLPFPPEELADQLCQAGWSESYSKSARKWTSTRNRVLEPSHRNFFLNQYSASAAVWMRKRYMECSETFENKEHCVRATIIYKDPLGRLLSSIWTKEMLKSQRTTSSFSRSG